MHTKFLLVVGLTIRSGSVGVLPLPETFDQSTVAAGRVDVRDLLASARGVGPVICGLASDGAGNGWGGSTFDAPDLPARADVRGTFRALRRGEISSDES